MRAAYDLALALADGPGVDAGTAVRDTWHAAWARRALQHRPAWRGELAAILDGEHGNTKVEHASGAGSSLTAQ